MHDETSQQTQRPQPMYRWNDVWTMVITQPAVDTFHTILRDPLVTTRRAFAWVFLTSTVSIFIFLYSLFTDPTFFAEYAAITGMEPEILQSSLFTSVLCMAPLAGLLTIPFYAGWVWLVQFVVQRLEPAQPNQYATLAYALASVQAPMNLLTSLLLIVPFLGILSLLLLIYQLVLMTQAVRAVYRLQPQQAAAAVLIPFFGILLLTLIIPAI